MDALCSSSPAEAVEMAIDYAVSLVGVKALKPLQWEAIQEFVRGSDVFVSLPTRFGKSMCYALYCPPYLTVLCTLSAQNMKGRILGAQS